MSFDELATMIKDETLEQEAVTPDVAVFIDEYTFEDSFFDTKYI